MSLKPGNAVVIDGGEIKLKNRICGEVGTFYPTGPSVQKHDTTANWSTRTSYIPKAGEIIVYTDYKIIEGTLIPNIKIGDGTTYVVDLPFVVSESDYDWEEHIHNHSIHVTPEEKLFWSNKVTTDEIDIENERLILTKL